MQQLVSVMIVDDEIMALNHLKNLIDWEQIGFKIVASETNPRNALTSFLKYRPQIVLADIMMPVMNGLDLSREILAMNIPVKILLLTSHKDFYYAKQAVEIGVSNYLLKHELNNETLISELMKLRMEIQDSEATDRLLRQRYIRSLVEGLDLHDPGEVAVKNKYIDYKIGKLAFLFTRVDTPYPILREIGISAIDDDNHYWKFLSLVENRQNIEVIKLKSDEALFVMYFKNGSDEYNLELTISKMSKKIQSSFFYLHKHTLTIASIIVENNIVNIQNLYRNAEYTFQYCIFLGRNILIDINKVSAWKPQDYIGLSGIFDNLESMLKEYNEEGLQATITELFSIVGDSPWNPEELQKICEKLVLILEEFRKDNHQKSLKDQSIRRTLLSRLENLYSVNDIRNWFYDEYLATAKTARDNNLKRYSRKVRLLLDILYQEYHRDISVDEIAAKLNISAVYLRKLFKKETGFTIIHYLTKLRMEKALELLNSGNYMIFEVAGMVGYNTSQYFSKVFKKYTGKRPQDYLSGA